MNGDAAYAVFAILVAVPAAYVIYQYQLKAKARHAAMPAEQRTGMWSEQKALSHGSLNSLMECPHCKTKGQIHTKSIRMKKGVSGGKAVAALMTAGISVLAVGLSRKEDLTQAWCGACKNTWLF